MTVGSDELHWIARPASAASFASYVAAVAVALSPRRIDHSASVIATRATGAGVTVTCALPETFPTLARIVAVPGATALTVADAPLPATVATAGVSEVQLTAALLTAAPLLPVAAALSDPVTPATSESVAGATVTETTVTCAGGEVPESLLEHPVPASTSPNHMPHTTRRGAMTIPPA